jgi:hypothetical protein
MHSGSSMIDIFITQPMLLQKLLNFPRIKGGIHFTEVAPAGQAKRKKQEKK